jgi:broad specificity phosphatase PhoE
LQTAEPLARARGIQVLVKQSLREISFGAWEGMRWADLQAQNGFARLSIESSPTTYPSDGESFSHFRLRTTAALNAIASEFSLEPTAAVTHLGVIRIALTDLAGIDPASDLLLGIDYCSVHQFQICRGAWHFEGRR